MSDIAKKTQPPGSWPGSKGAKTADDISDATAPRSAVAASVTKSAAGEDKFDEGTHYTHQKESSAPLSEIREEPIKLSDNTQDGLKDIEPTPMSNGTDLHEAGDEVNGELPEVDAEVPEAEGEAPEIQSEAPAVEGEQPVVPEESLGSRSSLTEKAKQAFDLASQNQPTSEARNQFLTSAKANLSALGGFSDKSKTQPPEIEGLEDKPEAPVDAEALQDETAEVEHPITDAQDQAQSFLGEEVPAGSVVPQTEQGETIPEEVEKAPTELQEQLPSDLGSQQPVNLENAPTELGSKVEGTIPEGTIAEGTIAEGTIPEGTIPEGVQEGTVQGTDVGVPISEVPASELPLDEAGEAIPATSQLGEGTIPEGAELPVDLSILKGGKVNKGGNVVNSDGKVIGRVTEGILMYLVGKKVDENGAIWSDNGKVIGKAEPISDSERDDMLKEPSPFESFPDAVVDGNGMVVSNGEVIGKVVSGDLKVLRGKSVDADGDILDRGGNVIGKAERWEAEPEPEPEPIPEVDRSILAGKRVNKAGNIVDSSGAIYGRVVEGDPKMMIGRMCDKKGNILSESGDIIGRAEVVAEGEREGLKEGPFAELSGCTVAKDGTVVTPSGDIVGRLVTGNPKVLYGRAVDEDGDVLDRNGNVLGKAERWEPEEVEKKKNPLSGRRVNREGNVVDADGNLVGKLTSGNLSICSGKEIDDDGDVVDGKGVTIGHVSLLEDIPEPEPAPQETPEEKEKREQVAQDKKLAVQMTVCVSQCLDKIRPICRMITEKIERAERTPEEERDEEQLVKEVRPLIEEGGRILTEAQGIIKGLDPDGRISANAKHKTAAREASSEEYQLADVLKDLTGDVTQCIENAKKKLEGMPHAKKELNPLWGLLNEPLFQILAAVGLLLNGVLSLVGRLLNGLGLGGLLDGLLGTLGLNRVLEGLGLGSVTESLTGGKKKKKSGGLLGGVLGG